MLERIDRYKIKERVGVGGQATVYLGEDTLLDRPVAVKVINQMVSQDPEYVESLMSEARLAAGLAHQNIATVYDFKVEGDIACIVMEYVPNSLDKELKSKGPMSPARTVDIMMQVCGALSYAHSKGFIHRDIKPHNILLSDDGTPKVTDFGIARPTDISSASALGTPKYMSPEQSKGDELLDIRSDIYSLGITLYEMLCGKVPFEGNAPQLYQKHLSEPIPDFPSDTRVDSKLVSIVKRCLQKNPEDRYQNSSELASALSTLTDRPLPDRSMSEDATVRISHSDRTQKIDAPTKSHIFKNKVSVGIGITLLVILLAVSITLIPNMLSGEDDETSSITASKDLAMPAVPEVSESAYQPVSLSPKQIEDSNFVEVVVPQEPDANLTSISRIRFTSTNDITGVEIQVIVKRLRKEDEPSEIESITSFRSFDITLNGIEDSNQRSGNIRFNVKKKWLSENDINAKEVHLFRLSENLSRLPTTYLSEGVGAGDEMYVRYEAETPGFSIFVVGIEPVASVQGETSIKEDEPSIRIVNIPDNNLRKILLAQMSKSSEEEITEADMLQLSSLIAEGTGIQNISGLENAVNLTELDLTGNRISDLSPLSKLSKLGWLRLQRNNIVDITPLENLTNLLFVDLDENSLSDISILGNLTNLTHLELNFTDTSNISAIASLDKLTSIALVDNSLSDLSPLSQLININRAYFNRNDISDIRPLSALTKLKVLELKDNRIKDVSPLSTLTELQILKIQNNQIADFGPLDSLTKLTEFEFDPQDIVVNSVTIPDANLYASLLSVLGKSEGDSITAAEIANLTTLDLSRRGISDISGLEYAVNLTELNIQFNEINDLTPVASMPKLNSLNAGINLISDLSPLSSLITLNTLSIDANNVTNLSPLENLTNLTYLSLSSNASKFLDLEPLSSLTSLEFLRVSDNNVRDIAPLSSLVKLEHLDVNSNNVSDISSLSNLTNLKYLYLKDNQISDITSLSDLTNLEVLNLRENNIDDFSELKSLPKLKELEIEGDDDYADLSLITSNE